MGNNKRQKPNQRRKKPIADADYSSRRPPTPFDPDASPKMRRLYSAYLKSPETDFAELIESFTTLVQSTNPISLLAHMTLRHGFAPAGFDPEASLPDPLTQWPLEWLQAFCLRFPLDSYQMDRDVDRVTLERAANYLRAVGAITVADRFRNREEQFGWDPSGGIAGSWMQEHARHARLATRNWSYRPHMVSIVTKLCERLDGWSEAELGFRLAAVPRLLFNTEVAIEGRVRHQRHLASSVFRRTSSPIGRCRRWHQSNLPAAELAHDLEAGLLDGSRTPDDVIDAFNQTMVRWLPEAFMLSLGDFQAFSDNELERSNLECLMPLLSYRFGDLRSTKVDHLTLGNPVWTRPFIDLGVDHYFCPDPAIGLSWLLDVVSALIPDNWGDPAQESEDRRRWNRARSRFLELETESLVRDAFPSATPYINSKFDDSPVGVDLENDLAVVLDDAVLVLEAKSHQVQGEVWRGAPKGMREAIEKLVLEPSLQSDRFVNYLLRERGDRPFRTKDGRDFSIDSSGIRSAVRANVVLDPFPIAFELDRSLRADHLLLEGDPKPVPTILLSTLESVLVLLPDELQRMHYLARRQILQDNGRLYGDEHDLLALYLDTGFNLPELEEPDVALRFERPAKFEVDPYLEQWFAGCRRMTRPERRLQPGWRRILNRLTVERPADWVTIGMALLDASAAEQADMLNWTGRALRGMTRQRPPAGFESWTQEVGRSFWRSKIIGVLGHGLPPDAWANIVAEVVERDALNQAMSCTVLLFDSVKNRKAPVGYFFVPASP